MVPQAFAVRKNCLRENCRLCCHPKDDFDVQGGTALNKCTNHPIRRAVTIKTISGSGANKLLIGCFSTGIPNKIAPHWRYEVPVADRPIKRVLKTEDFEETSKPISSSCIPEPDCNGIDRYRTADGSCTSERDRRLGMSNTAYNRLLPASYINEDWSKPIRQRTPRDISRIIFEDGDRPHPFLALATTHWGQLLAHDLTFANVASMPNGDNINCCEADGSAPASVPAEAEPQCSMRIGIRNSDPFYRSQIRCLDFVRTETSPANCYAYGADRAFVIRQINQATHYLDASMVYGSSDERQKELRAMQGGRLVVLSENGREFLPLGNDNGCAEDSRGCFTAGDPRLNHVPGLTTFHTLLNREHNRIADVLAASNPSWDDETIFQEARLIVIAEVQHITYQEWLPGIVGTQALQTINRYIKSIDVGQKPPSREYNPAISGEFAAAAFRFGHSTVDGRINLRLEPESLRLSEFFFRSGRLREEGFFDRVLRWMVETRMQQVDRFVTIALHGLLDNTTTFPGLPVGDDLISFNIQRGRDFGLRRYIDYTYWLGMPPVDSWEDLENMMDRDDITLLMRVYDNPGDIDLYVGGLLERHAPGAAVGTTFQAILMEQFSRTLMGDPMFYIQSEHFSPEQIREIRNASLSRLICDNSDTIRIVPRNSFRVPNPNNNPILPCSRIPWVDLTAWNQ